jgi:hypothetical protein
MGLELVDGFPLKADTIPTPTIKTIIPQIKLFFKQLFFMAFHSPK